MITIRSIYGEDLYVADTATMMREAVEAAVRAGVDLSRANLRGANLRDTNLHGVDLRRANLGGAHLSGANLHGADLSGADLSGADLSGANLHGVDLSGADLIGADLSGANLSGAFLSGAFLSRADLSGADLSGADLEDIKADLFKILDLAHDEILGLREALVEGRVDGQVYEGDCACLVGTVANLRGCSYMEIVGIPPNSARPAERWFLAICEGDTPETSQVSALAVAWIDEYLTSTQE